jgi:hypothetical protein
MVLCLKTRESRSLPDLPSWSFYFLGTPMAKIDWFRNSDWNAEIEKAFFAKLARARSKTQYLKIQALHLEEKHPEVSLRLLNMVIHDFKDEQYHRIHRAQAYDAMAKCCLRLNRKEEALDAFHRSFEAERAVSNVKTNAYLEFGIFIVENELTELYDEAGNVLNEIPRCSHPNIPPSLP